MTMRLAGIGLSIIDPSPQASAPRPSLTPAFTKQGWDALLCRAISKPLGNDPTPPAQELVYATVRGLYLQAALCSDGRRSLDVRINRLQVLQMGARCSSQCKICLHMLTWAGYAGGPDERCSR